ncbi:unnamed protein product, partial [Sphacelaria rigidula]
MMTEKRATRALDARMTESRVVELRQQVAGQEKAKTDLQERIQLTQQAVASKAAEHAKTRAEIATLKASRKEIVEAEKLQLSGQLESLDTDITRAGGAVEDASNRMQQANTDFSNLMAAMSAAFREYDHVVTTNRELERGATEAESALASLREATQRELTDLRETHDRQVTLNAEEQAAVDAHVKRKAELDGALVAARASLADLTMEAESTQKKAVEGEKRVREVGEAMRAEVERREKAMG